MESGHEKPRTKWQVNIRLDGPAYERLRAWAFLEGESKPGAFVTGLVEKAIEAAAEADPAIDDLARVSAEARAKQFRPPTE